MVKNLLADPVLLVLGSLILVFALLSVMSDNLINACVSLMACFSSIGLLYFSLNAPFVGISQFLIYSVGVTLLMLFAVMLVRNMSDSERTNNNVEITKKTLFMKLKAPMVFILCTFIFALMTFCLVFSNNKLASTELLKIENQVLVDGSIQNLGRMMMNEYIFPFELISVLLLVVFIAVIVLAKRQEEN